MRTIETKIYTKIYKINELPLEAQEKAHKKYLGEGFEYFCIEEASDSLKAFAGVFPIKVKNYELSPHSHSFVDFAMTCDDEIAELSGQRLATYIWNNYRRNIFKGKYYYMTNGRVGGIGFGAKFRRSKIQFESSCPLTGYCLDDDLLDPIIEFMRRPRAINFQELIDECLDAWVKATVADMESQESFEYFIEHADSNGYEFKANGTMV